MFQFSTSDSEIPTSAQDARTKIITEVINESEIDFSKFSSVTYAKTAEEISYVIADGILLTVCEGKVVGVSKTHEDLIGYAVPSLSEYKRVSLYSLREDFLFRFSTMHIPDDDITYLKETKYGYVEHRVFNSFTYTLSGKPINREEFFRDCLNVNDPFSNEWIIRNKSKLDVPLRYTFEVEDNMESLLTFYKQNPLTSEYMKDYAECITYKDRDFMSGGALRVVFISKNHDVIYKQLRDENHNGQHLNDIKFFFTSDNPFFAPLLSVFEHEGKLVLVFPKLHDRTSGKNSDDEDLNQRGSENRAKYLRSLTKSDSFCYVDQGALVMYDGVVMYRGSANWLYKNDIPIFFDLGECLYEPKCVIDLECV